MRFYVDKSKLYKPRSSHDSQQEKSSMLFTYLYKTSKTLPPPPHAFHSSWIYHPLRNWTPLTNIYHGKHSFCQSTLVTSYCNYKNIIQLPSLKSRELAWQAQFLFQMVHSLLNSWIDSKCLIGHKPMQCSMSHQNFKIRFFH